MLELLLIYQAKHFLADYIFQGRYMLGKFRDDWGFFLPLLSHVAVHGLFTLGICLVYNPRMWWLALVDMVVHFIMDRLKAGKKYLGRFKPLSPTEFHNALISSSDAQKHTVAYLYDLGELDAVVSDRTILESKQKLRNNTIFWWALGLDQMMHHLTHYVIIALLVA